ncbi:hypothetical protein PCK1_000815 [Pneumocystis canis]|nr:hypothetical protein PCK1_000815 [Pneumocystis canis]
MGPITKKKRDKNCIRHNPYFRATLNSKERSFNEKENKRFKNENKSVIRKILSVFNWTYTSIFGKTNSNELSMASYENLSKQPFSEYSGKNEEESMLSESLAPHLLGYTPQAVRIRKHYLKDIHDQDEFKKQKALIKPIMIEKQEQSPTTIIPLLNKSDSQKHDSFSQNIHTALEKSQKHNIEKNNLNAKPVEFLTHLSYSKPMEDRKMLGKRNSVSNNHLAFDCIQWPRNSSTGILTAWREICRQQEILLKNKMTELQFCKSTSMSMKENMPIKNPVTNVHTKSLDTKLDNIAPDLSEKEKGNIIQIQERKKNSYNRFNNLQNNFICNTHNLQTNNIENLKHLKENNLKQRKLSENYKVFNSTNINVETKHKRNRTYNFPAKDIKNTFVQKEGSNHQLIDFTTNDPETQMLEDKSILNHNIRENENLKNIRKKNSFKPNMKLNTQEGISESSNQSFSVNNHHKRKKSGYFSALEEDLEEIFGPYDIDEDMPLFKKRKEKDEPTNNIQKRSSDYRQPYFQPRTPLLKESMNVDTPKISTPPFNIDSSEKSNLSLSFKTKQIFIDKNDNDKDSKLDLNKQSNNYISFTEESKSNEKLKTSQTQESISIPSNQPFTFDIDSQKNTNSSNRKKVEPLITSSPESSFAKIKELKQQNTTSSDSELPIFTFNSKTDKTSDVSQIDISEQTTDSEKTTTIFSENTDAFHQSQDIVKDKTWALTKPTTDTIMEIGTSEKKKPELQSKTIDFNFTTTVSDTKNIFEFKNNELNSLNQNADSRVNESLKFNFNKDALKQKTTEDFTPILESKKTDTVSSGIFVEKSSELQSQNIKQETSTQSNENIAEKASSEHSFSETKSSGFTDFKNATFSFKPLANENNNSQTSTPFSFFKSVDNFNPQEKQSVQTNVINEEQKDTPSCNKSEFNFIPGNQPEPTSLKPDQVPTTSFAFGQNTQPMNSTSNTATTPVFFFGNLNQPKQEFSFGQSTPNASSFQTTPSNPPIFQFGGDKNKTNTHNFTFSLNNPTSTSSLTSPSPFVFGQSMIESPNHQTVPSFNFGSNTPTIGNYPQFQQQTQTNANFSFNTSQNTIQQASGASTPNPFAYTFNTQQNPIPGRKIAAPKSRLRRR